MRTKIPLILGILGSAGALYMAVNTAHDAKIPWLPAALIFWCGVMVYAFLMMVWWNKR